MCVTSPPWKVLFFPLTFVPRVPYCITCPMSSVPFRISPDPKKFLVQRRLSCSVFCLLLVCFTIHYRLPSVACNSLRKWAHVPRLFSCPVSSVLCILWYPGWHIIRLVPLPLPCPGETDIAFLHVVSMVGFLNWYSPFLLSSSHYFYIFIHNWTPLFTTLMPRPWC